MFYHDPNMLLCVVNTKLRDKYRNLEDLCEYEDMEKEKIIEKVVVKQAPVVNTVVATPQVACQATVKSVPSRPKPLITVEQGKSVVVSIDAKGNVMAGNNNTAVNVNLKK